jgi:ABC-2 type transport system ATP-binding protein
MPAVETTRLRKVYGRKVAVADLTLSIGEGEVFGFLGPNGAGKSTSVKMLVGLVRPTSGDGQLFGQPLGDVKVKRRIGFLPELFRFHEWLSADEFLDFHGRLAGLDPARRRHRAAEVLELVGLADRGADRLSTFSKGMLQRIGIAQALIGDPDLVILDEPTSALDPIGRRDVRDIINHLKTIGKTVFLNSHLLSEIEMVCDRVAIIDRGRVVREGRLADLLAERELDLTIGGSTPALLDTLAARWRVISRSGSLITLAVGSDEDAPEVAATVLAHGARLYAMTPTRRSLEDVFVQSVAREAAPFGGVAESGEATDEVAAGRVGAGGEKAPS